MKIYLISVIITIIVLQLTHEKCPNEQLLRPCVCTDDNIYCGGNTYYDLRVIFTSVSDSLNDTEKHFKQFYFNNTRITEFGINLFHDLSFEIIYIDNAINLTKINSYAFISSNFYTKRFILNDAPYNINKDNLAENNIFNALNSMVNIETIVIYYTALSTIPSNAFTVLNKLKSIHISFNANLKSIGNNAFYELSNLEDLAPDNNPIEFYPDNAFNFRNKGKQNLTITFGGLPLNNNSFSAQTFANINHPFELRFYNSALKYLDKKIFGTVLANGNIINFINSDVYLECDCKMYWIYENRDHFENQVLNSNCTSDGQSIFSGGEKYYNCDAD